VMMVKQKFPRVNLIQHETNLRFGVACNTGVKAAKADIVILLNSDVVPKRNFINYLEKHFQDPSVFSVGCKEIEIKNREEVISGRTEGEIGRGLLVHWQPKDQSSQNTLWTFGGSMAVDRKKYLQLGGFDVLFAPAYWEDIDLSFRAKQKGWKIIFEENSVVYHNHETTNLSVFGKRQMEILSYRNQLLFAWKNFNRKEIYDHFLWLPYHLTVTTLKSRGLFLVAFVQALIRWFVYKKDI